jgi:hypothetical protein
VKQGRRSYGSNRIHYTRLPLERPQSGRINAGGGSLRGGER